MYSYNDKRDKNGSWGLTPFNNRIIMGNNVTRYEHKEQREVRIENSDQITKRPTWT